MLCVDAVRRDVDVSKRIAASFESLAHAETPRCHTSPRRSIAVSDIVKCPNGTMVVKIRFERAVAGGTQFDLRSSSLVVRLEWDVIFSVAYPKEPCLWQFLDGRQTSTSNEVEHPVVRPHSFLMEEVLSRLPEAKKTYLAVCLGNAGGGPVYRRPLQHDAAPLASQTELPTGITSVEMYPSLGGSSNKNKNSKYNGGSGGGVSHSSNGTNGNGDKGVVGVVESPFLSDFTFLCNWWAALELDVGCILPAPQHFLMSHSSSGNMTLLEEDVAVDRYLQQGRGVHLMNEVGGNRVQRPGRGFAAAFMPRGDVVAWGMRRLPQGVKNDEEENKDGKTVTGTTELSMLTVTSDGMVPHNCGVGWNRFCTDYMEAGGQLREHHSQHHSRHYDRHSRRAQQALRITSVRSDLPGAVLPSLLVAKNILQTDAYELNDVCLYAEDPAVALCLNARISREEKVLNGVSNLFVMLRHLVKGVSPSASLRYALQLLVPALHGLVKALQKQRRPFWAGVAICCLLLPAVLNDRPALFDITAHLIDPVECYRCVSLVVVIFATVGSNNKFREAELARNAIMNAYRAKKLPQSLTRKSGDCEACIDGGDTVAHVHHIPIKECAVCGLPLLRNTAWRHNSSSDGNSASGDKAVLAPAKNDGCLIVQCAHCGHGGHVAHILAWWQDNNVTCCPVGCECRCVY
ncbi:hypothetical protein TraAM80_05092 [Trypanosoma rangeli]|uniref:Uncharacterized protein n=1 Tax=Trypanosoma rangeli TaxID=5698 RepID=A0A422NGI1_TRYRA|nr:uncharacterized protein TraAM80_05092 [Trypanosoma rangeli]RNF04585.1 hypothetical protein TraAM80_05092 [Trypanosoma rangeli]|eukprot:RNF04585.1 hypothetical protein TraAM80_05092 [Trypanosoma rangeli]